MKVPSLVTPLALLSPLAGSALVPIDGFHQNAVRVPLTWQSPTTTRPLPFMASTLQLAAPAKSGSASKAFSAQISPAKPFLHAQLKPSPTSVHTPSFLQGLGLQSSTSGSGGSHSFVAQPPAPLSLTFALPAVD